MRVIKVWGIEVRERVRVTGDDGVGLGKGLGLGLGLGTIYTISWNNAASLATMAYSFEFVSSIGPVSTFSPPVRV